MPSLRFTILVGDKTTANGTVISGSETDTWNGRAIAREGDRVDCPACKTIGVIRCDGPRTASCRDGFGLEEALSGDLCICRCNPPPKLVESQREMGAG